MSNKITELAWKTWEDWSAKGSKKKKKNIVKKTRSDTNKGKTKKKKKLTSDEEQYILKALNVILRNEVEAVPDMTKWYKWNTR